MTQAGLLLTQQYVLPNNVVYRGRYLHKQRQKTLILMLLS